jgi:hypothetical protein
MNSSSSSKKRASKRRRTETDQKNGNGGENGFREGSLVQVVTPDGSEKPQKPVSLHSKKLMEDLLYPLGPGEFLTKYFRRDAVHIEGSKSKLQGEIENRFQPIIEEGMHNLNTMELLQETSSDSVFIWLAVKDENDKDLNGVRKELSQRKDSKKDHNPLVQSIEIQDANSAFALHQSGGHALYCRAPPLVEQTLVAGMLRDTGLGCGQYDPSGESLSRLARGEVEMFLTAKAGGTTDWHFDFQENFTLQLSGVKQWTVQQGTVPDPLRACTPHYNAPDAVESQLKAAHLGAPDFVFDQPRTMEETNGDTTTSKGFNAIGPAKEVTLRPGDVFYFPAGMWHKIDVLEPGVSINISLMATNYASVTCQALQHYLLKRDEWRQVVSHEVAYNSSNALDHLKRLLNELPDIIREFEEDGGGAEAILPPVALQPPSYMLDNEDVDGEDDSDSRDGRKRSAKKKGGRDEENDEEDMEEEADHIDDDGDWEEVEDNEDGDCAEETIIDTWDFEYPSGDYSSQFSAREKKLQAGGFILNPLASLLRKHEIAGYYANRNPISNSKGTGIKDDANVFVLNVNYAGLESHESSVRVLLRDHPAHQDLEKLYRFIQKERHSETFSSTLATHIQDRLVPECPAVINCLIYYGYLILR